MFVILWLNFALSLASSDNIFGEGLLSTEPSILNQEDQGSTHKYHIVAYYESHSYYNICMFDPKVATILVYRWMNIDFNGGLTKEEKGIYHTSVDIKKVNPLIKTCIGVTGSNEVWSEVASSETKRLSFTKNIIDFLTDYSMDCLEINWRKMINPEDKTNLNHFVKDIKESFDEKKLFLMMMVKGRYTEQRNEIFQKWYDVPHLIKFVDYITLDVSSMQDYYVTAGSSPLFSNDDISVNYTVRSWISAGAPPEKLLVVIGASGQTFTLSNASDTSVGALAVGPGVPGPLTKTEGIVSFTETLNFVEDKHWVLLASLEGFFAYAYKDDQWMSSEIGWSTTVKAFFVREQKLGGMGVQILAWDDPLGQYGIPNPLLHITRDILRT